MFFEALYPGVGNTVFSYHELLHLEPCSESLDPHLKNLTKIPADTLLGRLPLMNHRLVHHCFKMVGFVINPKPLADCASFFPRYSKKRKIIIITAP
ncbi:hypothetical protein TNCV_561991 [Trichonephila clavipes]|uniref:Uncharacterized protein n=1 Tax=Trichonephila clavipes TaxID=2585209 RepID=A0A8X6S929_TRICX|nr:hypothetical protein TNCV_561991 [Trichonephila clavipes]